MKLAAQVGGLGDRQCLQHLESNAIAAMRHRSPKCVGLPQFES